MTTSADHHVLPRCCPAHQDLQELSTHLVGGYPTIEPDVVARHLQRALEAVEMVGLEEERLRMVELIARSELALVTGERTDAARLDPQRHGVRQT